MPKLARKRLSKSRLVPSCFHIPIISCDRKNVKLFVPGVCYGRDRWGSSSFV